MVIVATGEPVAAIIAEPRASGRSSDAGALGQAVDEVLLANPQAVADYRAGKDQAIGFLVGQVMKATRGQANAAVVQARRPRAARRGRGGLAWDRSTWRCGASASRSSRSAMMRARGPWERYQALKTQEANVSRYEAWRGGVRDNSATGASVMMEMARREARTWGAVAIVGVVLLFAGFAIR